MDTDEFIATTMRRVAASAVPSQRVTPTPVAPRRWIAPVLVAAAAGVVALIIVAASTLGSHGPQSGPAAVPTSKSSPASLAGCRVDYQPKPLPVWARAGFTPPDQPMPYVLGDRGAIAAILWDSHHPLVSPPAEGKGNKILWAAKVGAGDGPLRIRATLASTGQTVTRSLQAAPGPSIIDLPAAGCWSLDLAWGRHQDHLDLGFAPR